ncbi:hypothetical protein [Roseovarius sp. MBR-6]|jgi:hypothetical protein|uniref:hypothetical protein n=1 Tax=Roseovarius sp. MBR-6 TaxID=3156459 RepID=UPI00339464DB
MILRMALALGLICGGMAAAEPVPAYDLLFREGTLDDLDRGGALTYRRTVENARDTASAENATGEIALGFTVEDGVEMAELDFRQDERHRLMGRFPASVGNPMIMVFYEQVVRDMAATAGGSPFYIRNRIKEAMSRSIEPQDGTAVVAGHEVETRTVVLRPFADDPNRARMGAFADLELSVTMSEAVPGWYHSLRASTPDGAYRAETVLIKEGARP